MAAYDYDIGVIGGGAAGLTVCAGAAQLGAKVLLIEKEPALGGDCLHHGCVPSKTLIKTAHVRHLMATSHRFGLPSGPLPPADFTLVAGRIKEVIDRIQRHDSVARFNGLGVKVVFGAAEFSDEHCIRVDGRTYSARYWVIATGSSPAVPQIPGLERTPYVTNRELFDLPALPGTMVILGAGPIAIEMAQAFNRLGSTVYVIQRSGQILTREDKDMADLIQNELAREGVVFHLNARATEVRPRGSGGEVLVTDASGALHTISADTILVALGRTPNIDGLGLERIGVAGGPRGLAIDHRLRTSQRHIFVAGDATGSHMFTHAAGYEGGVVIANVIFRLPRKADYTLLPWCTYTHPELAAIGMNEKTAAAAGITYSVWREPFAGNDRAQAEGEPTGAIKLLLDRRERPIGVQIAGPQAGDLLGHWIAALHGRIALSPLAAAVHPYPTLGEINKKIVGEVLAQKLFSPWVRKALTLFFGLRGSAV